MEVAREMERNMSITLHVNSREVETAVLGDTTLLDFLRDELGLTGSKNGCGQGHCGACTVIVDGRARRACLVKTSRLAGSRVETIEGLADGDRLHPLQWAFIREGAVQCGFCTPGMIMAAKALLDANPQPTDEDVKRALCHNLCRCTGYVKIIRAVQSAAETLRRGVMAVPVAELPGFAEGDVSVQDAGAQLAAALLDVAPGQRVLDACAAPGGKTGHLLELADGLDVVALESDPARATRIGDSYQQIGCRSGAKVSIADQEIMSDEEVREVLKKYACVYAR
jgi:aerobic-type carbon monoxide dehydrogenase small subunit (CoxS/CutS family)